VESDPCGGRGAVSDHPIQGLMKTAMESIKGMVDVTTVVGEAVETKDGTVIVPVSAVSFGFAAGGAEYGRAEGKRTGDEAASLPFGGGSGAGVSVRPVGFLVVSRQSVRLLPVDERAVLERLVDLAPEVLERLQRLWSTRRSDGSPEADPLPHAGESMQWPAHSRSED
jgi:sporulation protein YtfJ